MKQGEEEEKKSDNSKDTNSAMHHIQESKLVRNCVIVQ